jgi:penicillin-binding protein 1C
VPASYALAQSLNIPAVKMLQKYNSDRFLALLKKIGFSTFNKSADHYGLSLILGGGEITLWELTGAYASLSRVLNSFCDEKKYFREDYHEPVLVLNEKAEGKKHIDSDPLYNASAIWLTYEALLKVNRPESETGWQFFSSSVNMAWKTGTSFGFRDAWAVGTTPDYVIGVWAGNAAGEGRPGLTGVSAAAPLLFQLVRLVKSAHWFETPVDELEKIKVCTQSGFKAGINCSEIIEIDACPKGILSETCPYHHIVHLNKQRTLQVTTQCLPAEDIINEPWFILTPAMEYFYTQSHPDYKLLPSYMKGCDIEKSVPAMEFIYPSQGVKIFIPRDEQGKQTRIIAEIAHRNPSCNVFWHLDNSYIGITKYIHQIEIFATPGNHTLTAVDEDGFTTNSNFTVVEVNRE